MEELWIRSTVDGSLQPSLFHRASEPKRPLLVGLHSWSLTRTNQIDNMLPYAKKHDLHLLLPEFRGPSLSTSAAPTEACGSLCAKTDIKDAIDYLLQREQVDAERVFLLGASGGGHMAMLMAGFCPEYFKAIGAFVPIMDLKQWADYSDHYREHILACCSYSEEEMRLRSPIGYLDSIATATLKIFHGKFDPIVPVTQSVELYTRLLEKYPSAKVFLDVFDGRHEMDMETAMRWLLSQDTDSALTTVTG